MNRLRSAGQSIVEYLVILAVVAIASIVFARNFLYDSDGRFRLFAGYVASAKGAMR